MDVLCTLKQTSWAYLYIKNKHLGRTLYITNKPSGRTLYIKNKYLGRTSTLNLDLLDVPGSNLFQNACRNAYSFS